MEPGDDGKEPEPPMCDAKSLEWTDLIGKSFFSRKGKKKILDGGYLHRLHILSGNITYDVVTPPTKSGPPPIVLETGIEQNANEKIYHFRSVDEELPVGFAVKTVDKISAQFVRKQERVFAHGAQDQNQSVQPQTRFESLTYQPRIRLLCPKLEKGELAQPLLNVLDDELIEGLDDNGIQIPKFFINGNYERMITIKFGDLAVTGVDIGFMLVIQCKEWPSTDGGENLLEVNVTKKVGGVDFDIQSCIGKTRDVIDEQIRLWAKESGGHPEMWAPIRVHTLKLREHEKFVEKKQELALMIRNYKEQEAENCDPLMTPRTRQYARYEHEEKILGTQIAAMDYSEEVIRMHEKIVRMKRELMEVMKRLNEVRDRQDETNEQEEPPSTFPLC